MGQNLARHASWHQVHHYDSANHEYWQRFEVQYLLGNGLVKSVSETIDIYTLTWGISQNDYSLGTAAGIFKSVVAIILILGANWIAKRAGEDRLF